MNSRHPLRICALYPSTMNIYADRGNTMVLQRRCKERGIPVSYSAAETGDTIDPDAHDLFYIGGGQDRDQRNVAEDMFSTKRDGLAAAAERGAVILAVCGGYQLLGHAYRLDDETLPGLGIVDIETVREPGPRLIGNIAISVSTGERDQVLAGFENHGGRTYLGDGVEPLGTVIDGFGNNGRDGKEGVRWRNVFGTYLHGPLLPKNSWFADYLIAKALTSATGETVTLTPLDDRLEQAAHERARVVVQTSNRGLGPWLTHRRAARKPRLRK